MSDTYDATANSERSYALWLAAAREIKIRAGQLPPNPDKPEECRWAREGSCKISELDSARG